MPKKIYVVDLTREERTYLLDFIKSGEQSARKLNRARILLLADENKTDGEIAEALHTGTATVQRTRQRFVEGNLEGALNERPRPGGTKKLDEKGEAVLETLAHSWQFTSIDARNKLKRLYPVILFGICCRFVELGLAVLLRPRDRSVMSIGQENTRGVEMFAVFLAKVKAGVFLAKAKVRGVSLLLAAVLGYQP